MFINCFITRLLSKINHKRFKFTFIRIECFTDTFYTCFLIFDDIVVAFSNIFTFLWVSEIFSISFNRVELFSILISQFFKVFSMNFLLWSFVNNIFYYLAYSVSTYHLFKLFTFLGSKTIRDFIKTNVLVFETFFESLNRCFISHWNIFCKFHEFLIIYGMLFVIYFKRNSAFTEYIFDGDRHILFKFSPIIKDISKIIYRRYLQILEIFNVFNFWYSLINILFKS